MDPVSNFLIALKNASHAGLAKTVQPYSSLSMAVAQILAREGFVKAAEERGKEKKLIEVELLYRDGGLPRISDVKRLSKPSRRVYMGVRDIRSVRQGYGLLVLSTPKGLMTDKEARAAHVGGEALFQIW